MKRLLVLLVFAVGLGSTTVSCPGPGPGPVVINAIVDCTLENQSQIAQLINEFKTLLSGQLPDWAAIYQRAKNAGKAIGGCALAELVQDYLGNRASPPPQADSWNANNALERFRREEAGNATFHTAKGDL
jgi:hypothetical protein